MEKVGWWDAEKKKNVFQVKGNILVKIWVKKTNTACLVWLSGLSMGL